jgi:hypothetical protein
MNDTQQKPIDVPKKIKRKKLFARITLFSGGGILVLVALYFLFLSLIIGMSLANRSYTYSSYEYGYNSSYDNYDADHAAISSITESSNQTFVIYMLLLIVLGLGFILLGIFFAKNFRSSFITHIVLVVFSAIWFVALIVSIVRLGISLSDLSGSEAGAGVANLVFMIISAIVSIIFIAGTEIIVWLKLKHLLKLEAMLVDPNQVPV